MNRDIVAQFIKMLTNLDQCLAKAEAHRQQGIFEIKSLYLEAGVRVTRTLAQDLAKALQRLAEWHQTPTLRYGAIPAPLLALWQEGTP